MTITRRDFLKLSGAGLLALSLADLRLDEAAALEAATAFQGRATFSGVEIYTAPRFDSPKALTKLNKDEVVDILALTIGEGLHNRVWYRFDRGYTYSGWIQPVQTQRQTPLAALPRKGVLGEVTVPFAETRRDPYIKAKRGYRLYYGSTYWITGLYVNQDDGFTWYAIYDKIYDNTIHVNATDMRIIPDDELAPLSPGVPADQKRIHVDLRAQYVTAFEDERMVYRSRCSSGSGPKTPLGDFLTYHKGPSIHMTNEGDDETNFYDLTGVPWCTFFNGVGMAFHGTYWHNDYGKPRSHGCINLPNQAAKFVYRWTTPTVPVDVDYIHQPGVGTAVTIVKPEV